MEVNLWAVLAAVVVMFVFGAFWYSVPFRSMWSRIHGFDKLSRAEQAALMKNMGPTYGVQLVVTILSAFILTYVIGAYPAISFWNIVFVAWIGFVLPSQVSAVLFSRTPDSYKALQVAIMALEALLRLLLAAWVVSLIV